MAHFAKINKATNEVLHVSVVDNWNCVDGTGNEVEAIGIAYLEGVHGVHDDVYWNQTRYNHNIRKQYAGIGFTYDESADVFIAPKPYASWVLNNATWTWDAPTARPDDGKHYEWDETTRSWLEIEHA
jgi:hypothetical protein